MATATETTLFDVPTLTNRQIAEIAAVLIDKMDRLGYEELSPAEKVELMLVRALLDGWEA